MSEKRATAPREGRRLWQDWRDALAAVLVALAVMLATAALGLWAAGAEDLPGDAFPSVVAATLVSAVGGSIELTGGAGAIAHADAGITLLPLSVSLVGALATGAVFLVPLRSRRAIGTGELAARAARVAVLWVVALVLLAFGSRHDYRIDTGRAQDILSGFLDVTPIVGVRVEVALTVLFGLLWLAGVLAVASVVSGSASRIPPIHHLRARVRPAVIAMLFLLLAYVVIGLVVALAAAGARDEPADTFAVVLLGLPNVVWLAFGIGLGASWDGQVEGAFGLPMPHALSDVLRTRGDENATVDFGSVAEQDSRAWVLPLVAAVVLLTAAVVMALLSPAPTPLWRHAVTGAVALAMTMLTICLLSRISAHYGLSLLGIGQVEGARGSVLLRPHTLAAVGIGAGWGLLAGLLGGVLARPLRRLRKGAPDDVGSRSLH